jgi:Tfp pilus assembly PilM family ATPase
MKIKKLSALKKIVAKYGLQRHKVIAALPATDGILKIHEPTFLSPIHLV